MHQFYHAVRTSEGDESAEQLGKPRLIIYIFVIQWGRGDLTVTALAVRARALLCSWARHLTLTLPVSSHAGV